MYALLVCKIFGPKIRSCIFFDKSQVCGVGVKFYSRSREELGAVGGGEEASRDVELGLSVAGGAPACVAVEQAEWSGVIVEQAASSSGAAKYWSKQQRSVIMEQATPGALLSSLLVARRIFVTF